MKNFNELQIGDEVLVILWNMRKKINEIFTTKVIEVRGVKKIKVKVEYRGGVYQESQFGRFIFTEYAEAKKYL
jgi:hypothetical protein